MVAILEGTFLAQFSIDMVLVSQQQQTPARDGESEPLLQKDLHATPTPRPSLFRRVLKVGGVLVAIDLLVCTLFIFLNPHWLHFYRNPPSDGNEIYALPRAVSASTAVRRHI